MAARIARADPAGLDRLDVDALVLPFFAVRAQPLGAAGSADWRMCGRLARMLREGRFRGGLGEATLMPTMARFGASRIFLVGLGDSGPTPATLVGRMTNVATVLFDAGAKDLAVAAPSPNPSTEVDAAMWWLEALGQSGHPFERISLLDTDGALEAQRAALNLAAQKAGFSLVARVSASEA